MRKLLPEAEIEVRMAVPRRSSMRGATAQVAFRVPADIVRRYAGEDEDPKTLSSIVTDTVVRLIESNVYGDMTRGLFIDRGPLLVESRLAYIIPGHVSVRQQCFKGTWHVGMCVTPPGVLDLDDDNLNGWDVITYVSDELATSDILWIDNTIARAVRFLAERFSANQPFPAKE